MNISLQQIKHCFDGFFPSGIATCSADGTPNVTYMSQVHYIDDSHVGLSWQFFNKTKRNVLENPQACLLVIDPISGVQYRLYANYKRTETEGLVFEKLKARIDTIASMSGMSEVFRLRGVDVYHISTWECMEDNVIPEAPQSQTSFEELNEITQAISECDQLANLLDTTLSQLKNRLGYPHSMVLLLNDDGNSLYTIASHGYEQQGAGAEVKLGEGIIGTVAEQRKPVKINNIQRENIFTDAIRERAKNAFTLEQRIDLPGLAEPGSQLAVPIKAKNKLLGVLFLETEEFSSFNLDMQGLIGSIANHLGTAILLCDDEPSENAETVAQAVVSNSASSPSLSSDMAKVRYYQVDKSIFIDNDYLIKGVAGAILWRLLQIHQHQGRSEFTNRELRLDSELCLPEIADNLEARLVLLKRRLDDNCAFIKMEKTGRGRFCLIINRELDLLSVTSS